MDLYSVTDLNAGEKFLRPVVFRGVMSAIFQIIGWSLVGFAANEDFGRILAL